MDLNPAKAWQLFVTLQITERIDVGVKLTISCSPTIQTLPYNVIFLYPLINKKKKNYLHYSKTVN